MRRKLSLAVATAALAVTTLVGPVAARAPESNADVGCLAAGLAVLQDNGGVAFFARNGVPLSLIGGEGTAPLSTVLRLHLSHPRAVPLLGAPLRAESTRPGTSPRAASRVRPVAC